MTESIEREPASGGPGLAGHLAYLQAAYAKIGEARDGGDRATAGQAIYVAGEPGSGRTTLLRDFAAALHEQAASEPDAAPIVLAGGFDDGRFVASGEGGPAPDKVIAIVKNVVALSDALHPYAELLGQVLSQGSAPLELVRSLFGRSERLGPTELLPRLLGALTSERRVVCLVDDADRAPGGLWDDLVLALADAVADDLPLLLVLALQGPARIGPHEDAEADSLYVARRLCERGPARWHPLAPVSSSELEAWTGPAAPDVLAALLDVTRGRAAWAALHWDHWRAQRVVVEDGERASWHFAAGGRERAQEPVDDVLGRRIAALVDDEGARDHARELLVCAALEGRTFTAAAVAATLGRDRDEVIDLLDDALAVDDDRPAGLVQEVGSITIDDETGKRHLWLYRFVEELDWLTLHHHHGAAEALRREQAGTLAAALGALYGRQIERVAGTLARLFAIAGEPDPARLFQRVADTGTDGEVLLWRGRALVDGTDPEDRADRRRASQTLIAAAGELFASGPSDDGLRFAQQAHRLAVLRRDQADALYLTGVHHINLGDYEEAHRQLTRVLALRRELGDRGGEADTGHTMARVDMEQGKLDRARQELTAALAICRELGDRDGEASIHHSLASIYADQGAFEQARSELDEMLEIGRALDDAEIVALASQGREAIDEAQRQQAADDDGEPPVRA
ncbi:MAG: tetratricopeptide repeat protein [Solirubrobacteraceae bacterium]|nr:tetratricopeptide repeat protein [Solirubrobacteraceae bacterium]